MNKNTSILLTIIFVFIIIIILRGQSNDNSHFVDAPSFQNVEIQDGVQYVRITARGGYLPRISNATAGIPTKLIVKTNGTYDCSASLVIRSIGYQKILPQNGEEVIDLGIPKAGTLQGLCSMGMYNFTVNFK